MLRYGLALAAVLSVGCTERASIKPPPPPAQRGAPEEVQGAVKLHLADGRLLLMSDWRVSGDHIVGTGQEFGPEREPRRAGTIDVPLTEVSLVETTQKQLNPAIIPMAVVSGASLAVTVMCIANSKACFGSCPTFYVPDERGGWTLQAEGFSTSIAKIFEADDIDDLADARARDGSLTLAMRNEALETHMIRNLSLLVVRGPEGSHVWRGFRNGWFATGALTPPESCSSADVCAALAQKDAHEVVMDSDGQDLAARTTLTLRYPAPHKREVALVLTARNSLMSTYVLYQMMALHGRGLGDLMASVERGDPRSISGFVEFDKVLGGIEVAYRQEGGAWQKAGSLGYIGPIARATRGLEFTVDKPDAPVEVELRFARSHWKLDAARLAPVLAQNLQPTEVLPEVLEAKGRDAAQVHASVRGQGPYVVTLPGDEIVFRFPLPKEDKAATGYFLHSRGYYYEWMRDEWLKDEDPVKARAYVDDPARALRDLAAPYKRIEPTMEQVFRASKFAPRKEAP